MGNPKTAKEIIDAFNLATENVLEPKAQFDQAIATLADIFTTGIEYTDERSGEKTVSTGLSAAESQGDLLTALYGKGAHTINEINRPGACQQFMTWYCLSKGITHDQIMSLSTKPDAPETEELRKKLDGMKKDFQTLVTGNDPEKLSDFYMETFKVFEKQIPAMLEIGDVPSLLKNETGLLMMSGATAVIQQSLEDPHYRSTETQHQMKDMLNAKIKAQFGEGTSLRDVLATLQVPHQLGVQLEIIKEMNTNAGFNRTSRNDLMRSLRNLRVMKEIADGHKAEGKEFKPFSPEMGKAAVINMLGYDSFDEDEHPAVCADEAEPLLSEMKALLGDPSGIMLYDSSHLTDFEHMLADLSPVSVGPDPNAQMRFFSIDAYETGYTALKNGGINAVVSEKMNSGTLLNKAEVLAFISRDNPECTDSDRALVETVMEQGAAALRGEKLPTALPGDIRPELSHVLDSMVHINFGKQLPDLPMDKDMTPEDYQYARQNAQYFRQMAENPGENALPTLEFHTQKMQEIKTLFDKAATTIFSSDEFKALDTAVKNLKAPEPGKEDEYRQQLEALSKAADDYITAKKADGKRVRSTQRGRDRMEFARRARVYAQTCLEGMNTMENILEGRAATAVDAAPAERAADTDTIVKRIDDIFGPNSTGSEEMIAGKIYSREDFSPKKFDLPENCPFDAHEIAMIGFSNLTDGSFYRGTTRDNSLMSDTELGESMRVHSTSDIFVAFRPNANAIARRFEAMRDKAQNDIKAYMNGDPKPLSAAIGQNIRASVRNFMSAENLTDKLRGDFTCLSETMNLLRRHPDLMKDSGLTVRDITQARFFERVGSMLDKRSAAEQKLKGNHLKVGEAKQAIADIAAFEIVRSSFVADRTKTEETPEFKETINELLQGVMESGLKKTALATLTEQNASEAEIQAAKEALQASTNKENYAQFKSETMMANRPLSPMIRFLGGKGTLEKKQQSMTNALLKTDVFKKLSLTTNPAKAANAASKEILQKQTAAQQRIKPPEIKARVLAKDEPRLGV